jgi:hypothetical protein
MHTLLNHSIQQMKAFQGIGDTIEDDVEMMHQAAARIESHVGRMKNKDQQALVHSKMEAMVSNIEVKEKIYQVKKETMCIFNERNAECCAVLKSKKLKEERDEKRSRTAEIVKKSYYDNLINVHKKAVADILKQDKTSSND